jgi:hypothetical protein
MDWFVKNGLGKKIILTENGWPSKTYSGVEPNSPDAVADIPNEEVCSTLNFHQQANPGSNRVTINSSMTIAATLKL